MNKTEHSFACIEEGDSTKVSWYGCPVCGYKKMLRVRDDKVLLNFPGYCVRCKNESLINYEPELRRAT